MPIEHHSWLPVGKRTRPQAVHNYPVNGRADPCDGQLRPSPLADTVSDRNQLSRNPIRDVEELYAPS
jgi:hypothetical protein